MIARGDQVCAAGANVRLHGYANARVDRVYRDELFDRIFADVTTEGTWSAWLQAWRESALRAC